MTGQEDSSPWLGQPPPTTNGGEYRHSGGADFGTPFCSTYPRGAVTATSPMLYVCHLPKSWHARVALAPVRPRTGGAAASSPASCNARCFPLPTLVQSRSIPADAYKRAPLPQHDELQVQSTRDRRASGIKPVTLFACVAHLIFTC